MSDDGSAYEESSPMDQSAPSTPTEEFELTAEQKQALALDQNIAITAGAGTGKTTTLTERYRRILEINPDLSPTQIVTITFTRDATSEMRDQIRDVVDDALDSADAETYDRWQRAKDDVEDAYIHTIHGFCSRILEEYAVEAGVHPDFETLDNGDAETLIDRSVRDVFAYVLDESDHLQTAVAVEPKKATVTDDVERLARLYSRDDLASLLAGLLGERPESNQWADQLLETSHEEYVATVFKRACPLSPEDVTTLLADPAVCEALETIRELSTNEYEFTDEPDDGIATLKLLGPQLPDGPIDGAETATYQQLFLDFCDQVTTGKGALYASATSYAGTASRWKKYDRTADHEALTAACETLIDALDPEDQPDLSFDGAAIERSIPYVYAIARLYQTVRAEYTQRKEAQHALDYSDLIERTIDFLSVHDRTRHELRDQFEYIMVDEVQDTDPRQWELVALLTGSDSTDFDGQNVFLVGDEKQSVYRFRRADVTMFRDARDRLQKANSEAMEAAQQLSGNFRTLPNPLTFINELFEEVFQPEGNGYQPYEARSQWLTPERSEGTEIDGTVEYLVVPETSQDVAPLGLENTWFDERTYRSKGEREAYGVAARLTQLFADPPQIYDPDTDEYRSAEPRDVALLFRTRTRFSEFERAFEEYDIPYSSFGARGFYETSEIQPLVNLLKVLQDPTQDIPLYGVLRSPLFGFTDEQLVALYDPDNCLWEQLATVDALEAAHDQLQRWRAHAGLDGSDRITTWAALLSDIIDDTGYLISIGADERPDQAVVNVGKFREQLRTWEEGSALPLSEAIERIERERDQESDPGEATIPTATDGVQLRTVHSAKGLEFPIVIVPELSRGVSKRATITDNSQYHQSLAYLETVMDEPVLGIKGPSLANSFETTTTPDYEVAKEVQQQELRAESRRLLYVATTRVRDHLLLTSTHAVRTDSEATFGEYGTDKQASCWRDLVQPILLEDRELLSDLATTGVATRSLGDAQYTVRRPPTPVAGPAESATTERACDIELPEPPESTAGVALSATAVRDLVSDYSSHDESQTETEIEHSSFLDEPTSTEGLAPTQFGTAVHRLCELSLVGSTIDWSTTSAQIVDTPDRLSPTVIEDLQNQVQYGVSDIQQLEAKLPVQTTYDEYQVCLELPTGQIVGDIDHLTVTDDCYYISDYKTDTLRDRDLETVAEHYFVQLYVYACALSQADSTRDYILRLIFTNAETTEEKAVSSDDINEWRERLTRALVQDSANRRSREQ